MSMPNEYEDSGRSSAPYVRGSWTSWQAAHIQGPRTGKRRRLLWEILRDEGPRTNDELGARLRMNPSNSVAPRIGELRKDGWVIATGEERRTSSGLKATVWRVTTAEERAQIDAGTDPSTPPALF